jgi:hypothetical protein
MSDTNSFDREAKDHSSENTRGAQAAPPGNGGFGRSNEQRGLKSKGSVNCTVSKLHQAVLRAPGGYIVRGVAMIVLAVCPSIICAGLAQTSGRWGLFERSGSVTTIIGLLLASRAYVEQTVTDLVVAQTNKDSKLKSVEVLSDILAAKRGLTLSAFGTLIWGWGLYLRWWSFGVLALWLVFVVYRASHDPVLQRGRDDVSPYG